MLIRPKEFVGWLPFWHPLPRGGFFFLLTGISFLSFLNRLFFRFLQYASVKRFDFLMVDSYLLQLSLERLDLEFASQFQGLLGFFGYFLVPFDGLFKVQVPTFAPLAEDNLLLFFVIPLQA